MKTVGSPPYGCFVLFDKSFPMERLNCLKIKRGGVIGNKGLPLKTVVFGFRRTLAKLNIDFRSCVRPSWTWISSYGVHCKACRIISSLKWLLLLKTWIANTPGSEKDFFYQANTWLRLWNRSRANGALFDDTRKVLQELKNREIKTGVVTRNCLNRCSGVISRYSPLYGYRHHKRKTPHVKPHPGHLGMTLQLLAAAPKFAAMVGITPWI